MSVAPIAAFLAVELAILSICIVLVARTVRVRRNLLFWYLDGEIDRRSDPVSYWFFAGQVVLFLALIPSLFAYSTILGR